MRSQPTLLALFILLTSCTAASAGAPAYSLDQLYNHPYRYTPAYGHVSQNPGSPKYFAPGYGYRIPGFGYSVGPASVSTTYNTYNSNYQFGQRNRRSATGMYNDRSHRFWSNSYGGPWYYPGSPANTTDRWPGQ